MEVNNTNYVWFVCYGINMYKRRFVSMLKNKSISELGLYSSKLITDYVDEQEPIKDCYYEINYASYFGSNLCRTMFLDTTKEGKTIGRAYLIKRSQYSYIRILNTKEYTNYNIEVKLGTLDDIDVVTITSPNELVPHLDPMEYYKDAMVEGLTEIGLSKEDANEYLNKYLKENYEDSLRRQKEVKLEKVRKLNSKVADIFYLDNKERIELLDGLYKIIKPIWKKRRVRDIDDLFKLIVKYNLINEKSNEISEDGKELFNYLSSKKEKTDNVYEACKNIINNDNYLKMSFVYHDISSEEEFIAISSLLAIACSTDPINGINNFINLYKVNLYPIQLINNYDI